MKLVRCIVLSCSVAAGTPALSQMQEAYKLSDAKFATHVDYKRLDLKPGEEIVLCDFKRPGKLTYFYITDSNPLVGIGAGITCLGGTYQIFRDGSPNFGSSVEIQGVGGDGPEPSAAKKLHPPQHD